MKIRGFLGLWVAGLLLAGCGSSTRTVTQTVTRTVTVSARTAAGTVPSLGGQTQTLESQATTTSSNLVASNGKPWQCPSGDTVQPLGSSVGCYNGSVLDTIQPYVAVGSDGSCPTGTEQTYLPNGGPSVCELQPQ